MTYVGLTRMGRNALFHRFEETERCITFPTMQRACSHPDHPNIWPLTFSLIPTRYFNSRLIIRCCFSSCDITERHLEHEKFIVNEWFLQNMCSLRCPLTEIHICQLNITLPALISLSCLTFNHYPQQWSKHAELFTLMF